MQTGQTKRSQYIRRWGAMTQERSSWYSHWAEISKFLLPRSGRFFITDRNKGDKRHNDIIDSTGTRALRTLAAGMMAGMTSPARPWFRLATTDRDLMEYAPVKLWLEKNTAMMRTIFAKSNTYRTLHTLYEELGGFGTAAAFMAADYDTVLHHTPLTVGEYCIATDDKSRVHTLAREFEMTVGQMVEQFGLDKLSRAAKTLYNEGNVDTWVPVLHMVLPRSARDYGKKDKLNMPWASCYIEMGADNDEMLLSEGGFKRFPGLCPRWAATAGDLYGNSPGMEALGDVKQLQHAQMRKSQAIDYQVKPPIAVPSLLKDQQGSTLPGGVAYVDMAGGQNKIQTLFDVRLDLQALLADIQDTRQRVNQTFYADLFLMLANDDRSNVTAREIAERHEEKLLMLGPVLERLHNELHEQLIDNTFDFMIAAKLVPPPPEEMQGQELQVEFVSMLAQAQRAVGTQSVDRLLGTIGSIAQIQANSGVTPSVLDKLDVDQIVDAYADMLGVDPDLIVADENVAIVREQRAQQQAAAQEAAQMQAAAETAKTASQADMSGENALTNVLGQFSGYAVPGTL